MLTSYLFLFISIFLSFTFSLDDNQYWQGFSCLWVQYHFVFLSFFTVYMLRFAKLCKSFVEKQLFLLKTYWVAYNDCLALKKSHI